MKEKFIVVTGKGDYSSYALRRVSDEVNRKMNEGYVPTGAMIHLTEKSPTDAYTQCVFIQPMVLTEELVSIG